MDLREYIRDIPDFPKEGIMFRDITPLLADKDALSEAIDALVEPYKGTKIDHVAAVEARGFIFGSAVAKALDTGFVPIRKPGKLPYKTESLSYDLEYGSNTIELHVDAIKPGDTVLMVDDLLATGGTMIAACKLIEKLEGNIIGLTFLIELSGLEGREQLSNYPIHTIITY